MADGSPTRGTGIRISSAPSARPVVLALALVAAAAACSTSASEPSVGGNASTPANVLVDDADGDAPTPGGKVVMGTAFDLPGWDPTRALWSLAQNTMTMAVYDRLLAYDPDGEPVPYVAESMEPDDELTSWTLTLRPGVRFSDGSELDADVVVQNLEAHRTSPITGSSMAAVESVTAIDERTVRIDTSEPWSTFPHLLTSQVGMMMAPAMFENDNRAREPIGVGPFVVSEWVPGDHTVLVANDDYWQEGLPYLDEVEFVNVTDVTSRAASLEAGDFDMISLAEPAQIQRFLEAAGAGEYQIAFDQNGEDTEIFVALNTSAPPFDDPLARELLVTALDTQLVSETVYEGFFEPARGPFKPTSEWFAETEYPDHDPARARELATRYEDENGGPLRFTANIPAATEYVRIAQLIQGQVAEYGIEIEINSMEQTPLIIAAISGEYEATGFQLFGSEHLDRESAFLSGATVDEDISLAITRMANPTVDDALGAARQTTDKQEQIAAYADLQRGLAEDLRFAWLVHTATAVVARNQVRGLASSELPDGRPGLGQESSLIRLDVLWKAD